MGYVAVKGGQAAIEASLRLVEEERLADGQIEVKAIQAGLKSLIDQVMSESGLYDLELAALAIKQAQGSPEEAVFLLRAFRSTLERKYYTPILSSEDMMPERRISASFKDIPGGQILGASLDYAHRLINFDLLNEETVPSKHLETDAGETDHHTLPKVTALLREQGLMPDWPLDNTPPGDITMESLSLPSSRSIRLQVLSRGQTGAVCSLGYAALRAYGLLHPTIGELRVGRLPVCLQTEADQDEQDQYYLGEVRLSEVESLIPDYHRSPDGTTEVSFRIGYGCCFGQNETKAIAMSLLDASLDKPDHTNPIANDEFVLYHIDSVESSGFISHLKLPHYVTFASKLDALRKVKTDEV